MRQLFYRFSLDAAKFNGQIFVCLFLIWLVLVYCAIVSIRSQGFSARQQRTWIWVVVGIPLVGLLVYLPFSIRREDLPQILLLVLQKERLAKKQKPKSNALPKGDRSA